MKPTSRFRRLAMASVASISVVTALVACAPEGSTSDDPFVVLYVGGVTGPYQTPVQANIQGLKAAAVYVNETDGGIDGRKIQVQYLDSQGDPTRAVSLLQEALNSDTPPDFVIPGGISPETLAMVPVLTRAEVPSFAYAASPLLNDPAEYPYHFQTTTNSYNQLATALVDLVNDRGIKKLSVITSQDEYGNGISASINGILQGKGVEIIETRFVPTDLDLTPYYQKALNDNPDFIYLDTSGDSAVRLLQARVSAGATDIPTAAGSGMSLVSGGPWAYGSEEANKNLSILMFKIEQAQPESEWTPMFAKARELIQAQGEIKGSFSSLGLAWDQIRLIQAVYKTPGVADDPQAFVDALYNLEVEDGYWLTASSIKFTPTSHTVTPSTGDFLFGPTAPMENGQYQVNR